MARTLEDVLARRMRALFLNARAALEMAPMAAEIMADELDWTTELSQKQLRAFADTAKNYVLSK
jgi:glycerol-3-phosphate dehydrogenase